MVGVELNPKSLLDATFDLAASAVADSWAMAAMAICAVSNARNWRRWSLSSTAIWLP
jgi:hypothetical protein